MVLERATEDRIAEVMYPAKITKGVADRVLRAWLGKGLKALDLVNSLTVTESYLIYIPFWRFTAQGLAVACGHSGYTEKTGNKLRNEYEELVDEEYIWTECACNTGQYGIKSLWLEKGGEVPYTRGKVAAMEASGSAIEANTRGKNAIRSMIKEDLAKRIDTVTFEKYFIIPKVFEIVYAPVWIFHYTYNTGHFATVIDAVKGEVIGDTSPMNLTARTRLMVLSFAAGAVMTGVSIGLLFSTWKVGISDMVQVIILLVGIALCMVAYPAFKEGKTTTSSGTMTGIARLRPLVRVQKELTDHEILQRNNTVLQCPTCGSRLEQPWGEVVARCNSCDTLLDITADEAQTVPYSIAQPNTLSMAAMPCQVPEYIPFWKFSCEIKVNDYLCTGNSETGLPNIQGKRDYFICAADVPRYIAEPWEISLTIRNPEYSVFEKTAGIKTRPIFINQKTARELTEFLFLRYETEKPGILQVLRYDFTIFSAEIVYLPYYKEEGNYIPGV